MKVYTNFGILPVSLAQFISINFEDLNYAKLLSGELSTYLGGRYVQFNIYPFSFAEFLELYRPITPEIILNYIKYCCGAYLFYQVKREALQTNSGDG